MAYQKVRSAPRAPGLFLCLLLPLGAAACNEQPDKKPAAEVVLASADDASATGLSDTKGQGDTPGFASINEAPKAAASADLSVSSTGGDQAVSGTVIDFVCNPDTPVSSDDTSPPAACELIIRTETRGDRRMLCSVTPCDAWAARGGLPQGIRGLQAEAWVKLADHYDSSGAPTGRVATVTRLTVRYTKPNG